MLTAVPVLPSQFQGVETDSFTFYRTEIPIMLDIQIVFCTEEKYEGDSVGGCVYWPVGVHKLYSKSLDEGRLPEECTLLLSQNVLYMKM